MKIVNDALICMVKLSYIPYHATHYKAITRLNGVDFDGSYLIMRFKVLNERSC